MLTLVGRTAQSVVRLNPSRKASKFHNASDGVLPRRTCSFCARDGRLAFCAFLFSSLAVRTEPEKQENRRRTHVTIPNRTREFWPSPSLDAEREGRAVCRPRSSLEGGANKSPIRNRPTTAFPPSVQFRPGRHMWAWDCGTVGEDSLMLAGLAGWAGYRYTTISHTEVF